MGMNNKGVTLIELVIAVAISSIVILMVGMFMNVGVNTFSSNQSEITIQQETQKTLNQLNTWTMEATKGVAVFGSCPSYDSAYVIYYSGEEAEDNFMRVILFKHSAKKLYAIKVNTDATFKGSEADIQSVASTMFGGAENPNRYVMCDFISNFTADSTRILDQIVTISLQYQVESRSSIVSTKVKLRNKPVEIPYL